MLRGKIYIVFIIIMVLFTAINIIKEEFDRRQRKSKEIIKLDRSLNDFTFALLWFVVFMIWLILFINRALEVFHLLNEDYISSPLQLLSIEYLQNLRRHFFENAMLIQLNSIVHYQSNLLKMLFWIIASLCNSIEHFYRGWQQNAIYENGILIRNRILKWNKIMDYKWSNAYESKLSKKGKYYNLTLKPHNVGFLNLDNETKLRVNYDDRELVNDILKEYIHKENI